jgi:hypothetical protein
MAKQISFKWSIRRAIAPTHLRNGNAGSKIRLRYANERFPASQSLVRTRANVGSVQRAAATSQFSGALAVAAWSSLFRAREVEWRQYFFNFRCRVTASRFDDRFSG